MITLGIETSCDETGVALYCSDTGLLSQGLHSQIAMHQDYGGVVPELASRDHIRRVIPLIKEVCEKANIRLSTVDNIAYTQGPGLAGALMVGSSVAKGLAMALNKPALGIHHLEGHLLSPLLSKTAPTFPFMALLVSGGHTMLLSVKSLGDYTLLGESIDDAAGEAFDKTAQLLGLPYPGGPHLAHLALQGNPLAYELPLPLMKGIYNPDYEHRFNFSFSGLKTSVLTLIKRLEANHHTITNTDYKADVAASFEHTIAQVLVKKTVAALKTTGQSSLVVAGGVGANLTLRRTLNEACQSLNVSVFYPELDLCTDNGAMIALAGSLRFQQGLKDTQLGFTVKPRWALNSIAI